MSLVSFYNSSFFKVEEFKLKADKTDMVFLADHADAEEFKKYIK